MPNAKIITDKDGYFHVEFTTKIMRFVDDFEAYVTRGGFYYEIGELEQALVDFDQVVNLDPLYAPAYYYRGAAFMQMDEAERAIAEFLEALRLNDEGAYLEPNFRRLAEQFLESLEATSLLPDFISGI